MPDNYAHALILLLLIAGASYLQAVVGFGFGLLVMGVVAGLKLMTVADAAILISLLAMVNTATALRWGRQNIRWREAAASLVFSLPMLGAGFYFLSLLSASDTETLRLLLGITILASSATVLKPPHREASVSSLPAFAFFGGLSGLAGGMFSTGGPPVVFQYYRQPFPLSVIRDTLLGLFLVGSTARTIMAAATVGIGSDLLMLSAIAFPFVVGFTALGRRRPPEVSETVMRRVVFILLVLSAVPLLV